MKRSVTIGGPVQFTAEEIKQARAGNYKPVLLRLEQSLVLRAKLGSELLGPRRIVKSRRPARRRSR